MAATIVLSYSELDSYRQCPHKHQLAYKERWQGATSSRALKRGILWHEVMEVHYRYLQRISQQDRDKRAEQIAADLVGIIRPLIIPDIGEQTEEQDLIQWMYQGYVDHWKLDEHWKIRAVEHPMEMWLPTERGGRSRFKLKLKIDLVVEQVSRGVPRLWIVDHKSGANLPKDKELDIDDQFGLYTWAMRQAGYPVHGTIFNAARTQRNKDQVKNYQPPEERMMRYMMHRTDQELDTIAREAYMTARTAYARNDQERHPNPDTCKWRCDFTDACLVGRKNGREQEVTFLEHAGFKINKERH